jgi:hypothetical protein
LKVDAPSRVRPCVEDLLDRETFRRRVPAIAQKAKERRKSTSTIRGGGDEHLLPEIRALKRRSFEILEARNLIIKKEDKVTSDPDPTPNQTLADPFFLREVNHGKLERKYLCRGWG